MKKDTKQRLFEVMSRLDKTFKPKLNEGDYGYEDDEENDPDAGHIVNGEELSPEEYRKWKEEEGEYEPDEDRWRKRW